MQRGLGPVNPARRALTALVVMLIASGAIAPKAGAQSRRCDSPAGRYEVTVPSGSRSGADPAELAAASCELGFREDETYPLSVIVLCLVATAGTLVLVRRGAAYEPIASRG